MIDARKPQILERTRPKGLEQAVTGSRRIDLTARYLIQQIVQLFV